MTVSLADLGRLVKQKFAGFEDVPDDELGRLVKARCKRANAGPAGEGRSVPSAPAASTEQTTGPAPPVPAVISPPKVATPEPKVPSPDIEAAITRAVSRLSGTARRDPDLKRMTAHVELVVTSGSERTVASVFQRRTHQEAT